MASQKSKFLQWIDYRVRVTIEDGRMLVGTFIAYDKHLNIVLSDTEEFRRIRPKKQGDLEKEIKRALGMIILRGQSIISIIAEAPPSQNVRKVDAQGGPGKAAPVNRPGTLGVQPLASTQAPMGLGTAPKGLGQPMPNQMMPGGRPGQPIPQGNIPPMGAQGGIRPGMIMPPGGPALPGMMIPPQPGQNIPPNFPPPGFIPQNQIKPPGQ